MARWRRPAGSASKAGRSCRAVPAGARDLDFLRSTQRCIRAPRIPAFRRLDLFGIPWILSSEMSLFNGLQATRGQINLLGGPFPAGGCKRGPSSTRRSSALKLLAGRKRLGALRDHGSRHRAGPIGDCDQTNADFGFLQGIVDMAPLYKILARGGTLADTAYRNPIYNACLSG